MDRVIWAIVLAGIFFSAHRFLTFEAGGSESHGGRPEIGKISLISNDIRRKSTAAYEWQSVRVQDELRLGDSIYTGVKSKAEIRLKTGSLVNITESTLVTFRKIDLFTVPDLNSGNLVLDVQGHLKIAVKGEVFDISGAGARIEVSLPKAGRTPVFKVVKSAAPVLIRHRQKTIRLKTSEIAAVDGAEPRIPQEVASEVGNSGLILRENRTELTDVDRIEDWYVSMNGALVRRPERSQKSRLKMGVGWRGPAGARFSVQASRTKDFAEIMQQEFTAENVVSLSPLYIGTNFWRVSVDRETWSEVGVIQVEPHLLKVDHLEIKFDDPRPLILQKNVTIGAELKVEGQLDSFLVETSRSARFEPEQTRVTQIHGKRFSGVYEEAGVFYFRARAVDVWNQVSDYSPVTKIEIFKPAWPELPRLGSNSLETMKGKTVALNWAGSAAFYEVTVKDGAGKTIARRKTKNSEFRTAFSKEGSYEVSLRGMDRWGRVSQKEALAKIQVHSPPVVASASAPPLLRRPSQEASSVTTWRPSVEKDMNDRYRDSIFQVEGAGVAMYSREEIERGSEVESAFTLTLRDLTWWGPNGVEGIFRKSLVSPDSGGGTTAPMQIEARYLRRWNLAFNPFSTRQESEFALKAGYEYYRNSGTALFAPRYDLLKLGFGLAFPMGKRMDTGGEALYGWGLDGSTKYEISGHLHYYLRPNLSMGAGYRIHLFVAGSDQSSPLGVPYREGYGEGYSVLRWHY